MEPLISVIVPVYNVQKYLPKCYYYLMKQSYANLEIILVDDGTMDMSGKLCDQYMQQDKRVKVIHKSNGGLASARNAGLEVATGTYVSFIDADDWIAEDTFEQLREVIEETRAEIIGFGYEKVENGKVKFERKPYWPQGLYSDIKAMHSILLDVISNKELFRYKVIRSACTHVFRRDLIERCHLRFTLERDILNEDYLFVTSAFYYAASFYAMDRCFYFYNTRDGSLTRQYRTNMLKRKKKLYLEYLAVMAPLAASKPFSERLSFFYINNMYECLTNEFTCKNVDYNAASRILHDPILHECFQNCRLSGQEFKAQVVLFLMKHGMVHTFYFLYKLVKE